MNLDDFLADPLNESQKIVLERIKKTISGLTVQQAKDILYTAIKEIDDKSIVDFVS